MAKADDQDFKRWELKVPIHCDGCARKVKKALHIDGVYKVVVDSTNHKVTVEGQSKVTAEALLKKLAKIGKHAELAREDGKGKTGSKDHDKSKNVNTSGKSGKGPKDNNKINQETAAQNNDRSASAGHGSVGNIPIPVTVPEAHHPYVRHDHLSHQPTMSDHHFGHGCPPNPNVGTHCTVHYHSVSPYSGYTYSAGRPFCEVAGCGIPPPPATTTVTFRTDMFNDENTQSCSVM